MSERLLDQNYLDTFVCELTRIDRIGTNRRLIFTVPSVDGDGRTAAARQRLRHIRTDRRRSAADPWP